MNLVIAFGASCKDHHGTQYYRFIAEDDGYTVTKSTIRIWMAPAIFVVDLTLVSGYGIFRYPSRALEQRRKRRNSRIKVAGRSARHFMTRGKPLRGKHPRTCHQGWQS